MTTVKNHIEEYSKVETEAAELLQQYSRVVDVAPVDKQARGTGHDLLVTVKGRRKPYKIEVKADEKCWHATGNLFIECAQNHWKGTGYSSRLHPSGIYLNDCDYLMIKYGPNRFVVVHAEQLMDRIAKTRRRKLNIRCGINGNHKDKRVEGYIIPNFITQNGTLNENSVIYDLILNHFIDGEEG